MMMHIKIITAIRHITTREIIIYGASDQSLFHHTKCPEKKTKKNFDELKYVSCSDILKSLKNLVTFNSYFTM